MTERIEPNGLSIYDMSGNLLEWCQDWYDEEYYKSSSRDNSTGPSLGKFRMLRGGSWAYYPWSVRAANRHYYLTSNRGYSRGFRLVLPVQQ